VANWNVKNHPYHGGVSYGYGNGTVSHTTYSVRVSRKVLISFSRPGITQISIEKRSENGGASNTITSMTWVLSSYGKI